MGRYKSVWSCDLQLCITGEVTVTAWEIEGKAKIQNKDTGRSISFGGGVQECVCQSHVLQGRCLTFMIV